MAVQRVVVIGEDAFSFGRLRRVRRAHELEFRGLFRFDEVQSEGRYPLPALYAQAIARLDAWAAHFGGIIGYWDFPVTSLVPLLARRYGLVAPSLEAVLKCEHKYWSRLEQQRAIPDLTPPFRLFDPFDAKSLRSLDLPFPFWVKPIKSHSSQLGFLIEETRDLERALRVIRAKIGRFAEPFQFALDHASLPEDVAHVDGRHCLAEAIIAGEQCTAEGFVHRSEVHIYAIIDSIRHRNGSSFARYQYPSQLPAAVQARIVTACRRVMEHIEYDNATFNIEFFWDKARDRLWILEINPRLSQSHADITEKVDGVPNLDKMVEVALDRMPDLRQGQGAYRYAAKCFVRSFQDALVKRVPSPLRIRELERRIPGIHIQLVAQPGRWLSTLQNQDSYSFELALVHIGADEPAEILDKYRRCCRGLQFELLPAPTAGPPSDRSHVHRDRWSSTPS